MDFLELAKRRYSTRQFQNREIEEEKLGRVLEAGRVAPSAHNNQPLRFIVIKDKNMRAAVAKTFPGKWLEQAPVIIAVCGDHSESWRRADGKDYCDIDAAIAADHMTLAAAELGLGTCWICYFNSFECHQILELSQNMEVIALLPIGYAGDQTDINRHKGRRKKLEEIVRII